MNNSSAPEAPIYNKFDEVLRRYDITGEFASNLKKLEKFKVILICDDSTSMRETLTKGQTKWDELRNAVRIVIDVTNSLDIECDLYFLNKPGLRNIKYFGQLENEFNVPPYGSTPLNACFDLALKSNLNELTERNLLIVIFTDGCPTSANLSQKDAIKEFKQTLKNRQPIDKIFVSIVACTDDDYSLNYLNDWDLKIKNLDVVDDYESERKEIYAKKRKDIYGFSFGDYIAKILLGS
jgi:hypothetical protein